MTTLFAAILSVGLATNPPAKAASSPQQFVVIPEKIELSTPFGGVQLLVAGNKDLLPTTPDYTQQAQFTSRDESVVRVIGQGRLVAVGPGSTEVFVTVGDKKQSIPVNVSADPGAGVTFDGHIRPLISRLGCNAGACHASQFGKGGFVLSVFGFDPGLDHRSMVVDREQRRINPVEPEQSLLLLKPTLAVPHGGGRRLRQGSPEYQMLASWIEAGTPGPAKAAEVSRIEVLPKERLCRVGDTQQLRVIAHFEDESVRDITHFARFDSMDEALLTVTAEGMVTVTSEGQAAVMVRFDGQANIALFVTPYGPPPILKDWKNLNAIDELAANKFRELGITPSPLCDDATFLRRAFLDAIGTLPPPDVTKAFLSDKNADKRTRLVDQLLGLTGDPQQDRYNDQYAAYWTLKWSDLLRNSSRGQAQDEQRMWAMHNWIKESLRTNKPVDQFVRELVTAKGSIYGSGPASYYRIFNNSSELAEATAQLFLGVRLQCAQCHHHPFESYSQEDYYSFAAFFARVGTKNSEEFGLFGREQVVIVKNSGEVKHPKTGKTLPPRPLNGEALDDPLDRRIPLAAWLTSTENRDFARNIANRYTAYLLGRGLVEPIDDMRGTNPPTNPALLELLADEFIKSKYDLKQLIRLMMTSRLYQLDSQPTEANRADDKFYSHYHVKRIAAEPLLDAIDSVTGVPTKFKNLPLGTRAIELPDGEYPDYFLNTFGKPRRVSVCECERMPDENLGQALHTINGDILAQKIGNKKGQVQQCLKEDVPETDVITDLYLRTLCRYPTAAEIDAALAYRKASATRQEFVEDLLWALVNSKGFLFVQ